MHMDQSLEICLELESLLADTCIFICARRGQKRVSFFSLHFCQYRLFILFLIYNLMYNGIGIFLFVVSFHSYWKYFKHFPMFIDHMFSLFFETRLMVYFGLAWNSSQTCVHLATMPLPLDFIFFIEFFF